ncbi:hypothetical protein H0H93_012849 [Arthromyces matolae]|nr:hypothetical protein H0H93_012849 [Arthromyces matolae]
MNSTDRTNHELLVATQVVDNNINEETLSSLSLCPESSPVIPTFLDISHTLESKSPEKWPSTFTPRMDNVIEEAPSFPMDQKYHVAVEEDLRSCSIATPNIIMPSKFRSSFRKAGQPSIKMKMPIPIQNATLDGLFNRQARPTNARSEPYTSSKHIAPDAAQLHIVKAKKKFELALANCGYSGTYSIHAGLNRETVHLQDPEQEIYLVLEPDDASSVNGVQLQRSVDEVASPFVAIVIVVPLDDLDHRVLPSAEVPVNENVNPTEYLPPCEDGSEGGASDRRSESGPSSGATESYSTRQGLTSNDHDGSNENDEDQASGGDGSGPNNLKTDKRVFDSLPGPLHIPFSSSLIHKIKDRKEKFEINCRLKVAVNEKVDPEIWPGPLLEVDMKRLQASHQSRTNLYSLGLCQVQIAASSCRTTVLDWSPDVVHAEDSTTTRDERGMSGTASLAVALNPSLRVDGKLSTTKSVEREQQPWVVSSYSSDSGSKNTQGILWNYLRNLKGGFSPILMEHFQRKPRLSFGLDNVFPVVLPRLKVHITILWSFDRQLLGKRAFLRKLRADHESGGLPANLDIMHHVLMEVDLQRFTGIAAAVLEDPLEDEIPAFSSSGGREYHEFAVHRLSLCNSPQPSVVEVEVKQAVQGRVRGVTIQSQTGRYAPASLTDVGTLESLEKAACALTMARFCMKKEKLGTL